MKYVCKECNGNIVVINESLFLKYHCPHCKKFVDVKKVEDGKEKI